MLSVYSSICCSVLVKLTELFGDTNLVQRNFHYPEEKYPGKMCVCVCVCVCGHIIC